jgi:hypothetical protein
MSAKVLPFESPRTGSSKMRSRESFEDPDVQGFTKSPRSPRTRGKLSRQNSDSSIKATSRQNSFQGGGNTSSRGRRSSAEIEDDGFGITDHGSASSARGSRSSRGKSKKNTSSASSKKRVVFSVPLIDPRPEKPCYDLSTTFYGDNSLTEEEFGRLQGNEDSDPITPRRMKKRRRWEGKWRRYIPFGQYIPTLPSFSSLPFSRLWRTTQP